jgi:predicted transcriptional regulator
MTTMTVQNIGRRKPAQLEMIGGKSARQRIWEELRKQAGQAFEIYPIARRSNVDDETLKTYLQCLTAGGFIERVSGKKYDICQYRLLKDSGTEAPRLTRKGEPVKQGLGVEAVWRTLRIMGELDVSILHQHVSVAGVDITVTTVKRYICALRKAGYLETTVKSTPHRMERFRLKASMNTGPRPPQVQNVKTVYDPNLNKVMYAEDPEELL